MTPTRTPTASQRRSQVPEVLRKREFWYGVAALYLVLKFGDKVPVVGPYVAKLKA